jgi:hypothetical protein
MGMPGEISHVSRERALPLKIKTVCNVPPSALYLRAGFRAIEQLDARRIFEDAR